jgi:hypothetical protein
MTNRSGDRMEAELSGWLRGLEPSGTPVALRVRTFADLRDEAERPLPRFVWLRPTLSAVASLGAVALAAGAIMVLSVILGSAGHGVGGPGQGAPVDPGVPVYPSDDGGQIGPWYTAPTQNPVALLFYLLAICIAGGAALLPRVQRTVGRLVSAGDGTVPLAPLLVPRSVSSVPRLVWLMGAAAIAIGALVLLNYRLNYTQPPGYTTLDFVMDIYPQLGGLLFAFVIALRYPMADRASRFLLLGALASMLVGVLFVVEVLVFRWTMIAWPWTLSLAFMFDALNLVGAATAIGVAGRAGSLRKPPLWLAAAALGAAFAICNASLFLNWFQYDNFSLDLGTLVPSVTNNLSLWIASVATAGTLWVGICMWRHNGGSWAWKLILVSGLFGVASSLTFGLVFLSQTGIIDPAFFTSLAEWLNVLGSIGMTALLLALAIGLRPVPPASDPGSAALDPDVPAEIRPNTEVAGETAGH